MKAWELYLVRHRSDKHHFSEHITKFQVPFISLVDESLQSLFFGAYLSLTVMVLGPSPILQAIMHQQDAQKENP